MSARTRAADAADREAGASAARTVVALLGTMELLFMELPLLADPRNQQTIDRLWAVQEAAEVFAKQVQEHFDGAS